MHRNDAPDVCVVAMQPMRKRTAYPDDAFVFVKLREVLRQQMGEWKAQISLRVRQALRAELEEFAAHEKRKLGNVAEVILEWGFDQLKAAGSIDRLLKYKIRSSNVRGKGL